MNREELFNITIELPSEDMKDKVQAAWDRVAKPLDSLGEFERVIAKIGAIEGTTNVDIGKKAVVMMCADNGIVAEGVTQSNQDVTAIVAALMGRGESSVCKMAKFAGIDTFPIDIGINSDEELSGVRSCKVAKGTKNFLLEPAMSEAEALSAIRYGIDIVEELKEKGYKLIATGEMGIGNTTTSAAIICALCDKKAADIAGRGAGLDNKGLARKIEVIDEAISKYEFADAFDVLCKVGGLDIAGLVGVFLGGAIHHVPIVIDGIISEVAAFVAEKIIPGVREYMIASHKSKEKASTIVFENLGLNAVIDARLALGEGTGAVMMCQLLDMAMTLYESDATFEEIKLEQYERFEN